MSSRDYQRLSVWLISTLSAAACAVAQPTATPPASPQAPLACERWFADADAKLKQGQAADALVLYELAAKECPDSPRVHLRIAMAALQSEKGDRADVAIRRFLALKPEAATDPEVTSLVTSIAKARSEPSKPAPPAQGGGVGTPLGEALSELDRQIGLHRGKSQADAEALELLRDCIASTATGEPMSTLDKRRIERLAEAAEQADPCTGEGRRAVEAYFQATRVLMCKHPEGLEFIARRAQLALKWRQMDAAWVTGRVLAAMKAEHAEGHTSVLDAVIALQGSRNDLWSASEARKTASKKVALELLDEAKQAAEDIADASAQAQSYWVIFREQARAGDVAGAKQTFETAKRTAAEIDNRNVRVSFYIRFAHSQAQAGDVTGARHSIQIAKHFATGITSPNSKRRAYVDIAEAQVGFGDVAEAKQTAAGFDDACERVNAYCRIAMAQSQAGDLLAAKRTIDAAKQSAAGITDKGQRADMYSLIAQAQAEAGDVAGAKATAAEFAGEQNKARAYYKIATAQANAGDVTGAKQIAAGITDERESAYAYGKIAEAQARAGDVAGAKQTAAGIAELKTKATAYSHIASAQAKAGDEAGAKQTFDMAKQAAAGITDAGEKFWAYRLIADVQAKAGDGAGAKQTLDMAKQAAAGIDDRADRSDYYGYIAELQARVGNVAGAKLTAAEISDDVYAEVLAYSSIAEAQARAGDIAAAWALGRCAQNPRVRAGVLIGAAVGALKFGDPALEQEAQ